MDTEKGRCGSSVVSSVLHLLSWGAPVMSACGPMLTARGEFLQREGPSPKGTSGGLSTQVFAKPGRGGRQAGREDQGWTQTDMVLLRAVKDRCRPERMVYSKERQCCPEPRTQQTGHDGQAEQSGPVSLTCVVLVHIGGV